MKDHEFREVVNSLRDMAQKYGQTEQLRERCHEWLKNFLTTQPAAHGALPEPKDMAEYRGSSGLYAKGWNDCLNNVHENEAVRKDAARYQALRNTPEIFIGVAEGDDMVFLKSPDQLDQLADNAAAIRAQGDGGGA